MAQLVIEIPDAIAPRVLNTLCARFGYSAQVPDGDGGLIDNPETKGHFVKRKVAELLRTICIAAEAQQAEQAARNAAHVAATNEIDLPQP
jgi:hypothetical protein